MIHRATAIIYRPAQTGFEFLLTQERSGNFTLPGGGQEPKDATIEQALVRELTEELSLKPDMYEHSQSDYTVDFVYQTRNDREYGRLHGFLVTLFPDATLKPGPEIKDTRWSDYQTAMQTLRHKDTKELLERVYKDLIA